MFILFHPWMRIPAADRFSSSFGVFSKLLLKKYNFKKIIEGAMPPPPCSAVPALAHLVYLNKLIIIEDNVADTKPLLIDNTIF